MKNLEESTKDFVNKELDRFLFRFFKYYNLESSNMYDAGYDFAKKIAEYIPKSKIRNAYLFLRGMRYFFRDIDVKKFLRDIDANS